MPAGIRRPVARQPRTPRRLTRLRNNLSPPGAFLGLVLIWTTTPLAIQWSGDGPGYLFGVTGRIALGGALTLIAARLLRVTLPRHRRAIEAYCVGGVGIYLAMILTYWAAQQVASGLIAVIFGLTPAVTSVLAALWLSEKALTAGKIAGLLLGFAGLTIIFRADVVAGLNARMAILALLAAVFVHATSTVWIKRISAHLPALAINAGALPIATILYALTWWVQGTGWPETISNRAVWSIVYLAVLGTLIGFNLYLYVVKRMKASTATLVTLITPLSALLLGQALNNETTPAAVWLGTAFITTGLVAHQWREWRLPGAGRRPRS